MTSPHLRRVLPVLLLIPVLGATSVCAAAPSAAPVAQKDQAALSWLWDLVTHLLPMAGPQIDPDGNR
jgi:hypothetical protein